MEEGRGKQILGVIGGMGPEATSYFYENVIAHTKAQRDQDHLNMVILSHADIPDRTEAIKSGDNLLIFPEGTRVEHEGDLPAKGGVAVIGIRSGAQFVPVYVEGNKRLFHRTRIIIGKPYEPHYTGRRGTSEEMQKIADEILKAAYALGGQAVGGTPLCGK